MLLNRIYEWARLQPGKTALIFQDTAIDYATFARAIEASRTFLAQQALPAGSTAVVMAEKPMCWIVVLALRALGLTTICVQSLAQARALRIGNVSCLVTTNAEHKISVVGARLVVVPELNTAQTRVGELPVPPQNPRSCGGHILYTSGTTGTYKKLLWDSEREDAQSALRLRLHGFDRNSVIHGHNFGLWTGVGWKASTVAWHVGACLVSDNRRDWIERFFDHHPTFAYLNPRVLSALLAAKNIKTGNAKHCELWIGSSASGFDLLKQGIAKFGTNISVYYAATELAAPVLVSRVEAPEDAMWLTPVLDRTIEIIDERRQECLPGQDGELRILTTELDLQFYLGDEEATSKTFHDGYFYPGDVAVRHADGRIRILGRATDVINVQGRKVAVGPIEQKIQQHLQVDEVCVFSGVNDAGQDEIVIAIQSDREPSRDKLAPIAREFSSFESVRFAVLKEFPRTDAGGSKVRRSVLRKIVFSDTGTKASGTKASGTKASGTKASGTKASGAKASGTRASDG